MFDESKLNEPDQKLLEKMHSGSWYYAQDLAVLWDMDPKDTNKKVGFLYKEGAFRKKKSNRNYSLQGAPSTTYARESAFRTAVNINNPEMRQELYTAQG